MGPERDPNWTQIGPGWDGGWLPACRYVHIRAGSVRVTLGQRVACGEQLCESGDVGFSPGAWRCAACNALGPHTAFPDALRGGQSHSLSSALHATRSGRIRSPVTRSELGKATLLAPSRANGCVRAAAQLHPLWFDCICCNFTGIAAVHAFHGQTLNSTPNSAGTEFALWARALTFHTSFRRFRKLSAKLARRLIF